MQPKRSLGQNFFVNENLSKQIVSIVLKDNPKDIVEIGPGKGVFTDKLIGQNREILLIEKDNQFSQELKGRGFNTINIDFLDWDFKEISAWDTTFFGSLPYNVSKPIIHKIISSKYFKNPSYFIIQKEVADKYISREPNNNLLSLRTQIYANSKKLMDIKPSSFKPMPKVNSSLIMFTPVNNSFENLAKLETFLEICFQHPRKTLRNNLKQFKFRSENSLLLEKRPQHLCLEEYYSLFIDISSVLV